MTDETQLLNEVFTAVEKYCEARHDNGFKPNDPIVRLHEPTFSAPEINAALECMLTTYVTQGAKVKKFESEFNKYVGLGHGVMNNSGSSANLLALAALANPATPDGLKPGDEVIVPALSWSTTVWPIVQMNLVPVIVDIDPKTFNIDPAEIERAIGPKTRAVMIVPVYGNPCDMDAICDICDRHNLILIEDCCEALGASYDGKHVGQFGRVATFSFYFSHHIATMEGGITVTNDFELVELMRILRAHGWIREVEKPEPFLAAHPDIDPRFLFTNIGYNLRATELQGAMGSIQLPKLDGFVDARRESAADYRAKLSSLSDVMDFQEETDKGRHSWFGFPMVLKEDAPFTVAEMRAALNTAKIETRPIICGNIARQPAMKLYEHRVSGDLKHADAVMERAFSVGNHQDVNAAARDYVTSHILAVARGK